MSAEPVPVSVVIPTFNRCEDCVRAVASVLAQDPPPLEVLVCDNGSTDATRAKLEPRQSTEPRLRYLRIEINRGTPAPARNLGISEAIGEWIAFLDDDDRWLAGKLAVQAPLLAHHDVVATDAFRSSGGSYFASGNGHWNPSRADLERSNPVILSSCLARRRLLIDARGFDEDARIAGAEDYDLLLRLGDRGARFVILDTPTVDYRDHGSDRLSSATLASQRALLRVRWRRWLGAPRDPLRARALAREVYATLALGISRAVTRLRRRRTPS